MLITTAQDARQLVADWFAPDVMVPQSATMWRRYVAERIRMAEGDERFGRTASAKDNREVAAVFLEAAERKEKIDADRAAAWEAKKQAEQIASDEHMTAMGKKHGGRP